METNTNPTPGPRPLTDEEREGHNPNADRWNVTAAQEASMARTAELARRRAQAEA